MKKKEVLLTDELFEQISNDKSKVIIDYRNKKYAMVASAKEEKEILSELKAERERLNQIIAETKQNLVMSKIRNFVLYFKLNKQKRLSKKLNNKFSKGKTIIDIKRFYPEIKTQKRK